MRWWTTLSGEMVCDCDRGEHQTLTQTFKDNNYSGWVKHPETDSCHQLSTQAWCPEGQLLQVIRQEFTKKYL